MIKIKELTQKELEREIKIRIDELLPFLEENEKRAKEIIKLLKDYPIKQKRYKELSQRRKSNNFTVKDDD